MSPRSDRIESGFTLVEVVVALLVASMTILLIVDGTWSSARKVGESRQGKRALLVARSLAVQSETWSPDMTERSGETGGLGWTATTETLMTEPNEARALLRHRITVIDANEQPLVNVSKRTFWSGDETL